MRIGTFDIETNGFLPELDRVWCAAVREHGGGMISFTPETIHQLPTFLEGFDVLCGHNCIAFDFPALRKVFGWEYKGKIVDTLIMSRTQRPLRRAPRGVTSGPHSVEAWGKRLGHNKVEHNEWDRYSPAMLHRCKEDVDIQIEVFHALMEEGKGEGWGPAHRMNMKLFRLLQKQEEYGWLVDREWMEECLSTLERWMQRIDTAIAPHLPVIIENLGPVNKPFKKDGNHAKIAISWASVSDCDIHTIAGPFTRLGWRRVDPDSNKEVKSFLLDLGWQPEEWNVNNAGEKTSPKLSKTDHFKGIQGGFGKLIAKRVQCKQRRGTLEGWKADIRSDGRIPASVGGVASTGRLRHKGIVNVPSPHSKAFFAKQMRSVFIAQPGWVLVGVDSKGNQVRQLAARMGDEDFTRAVLHGTAEEGTDLHSVNQRASGAPSRSRAKNFFYGFIFGAGDAKIGQVVDGSAADGRRLKEKYLNNLPKLKELIARETERWRQTAQKWFNKKFNRMEYRNGYIKGLDGRPILVDSEHKILCYLLQSDEAIQMALAYVLFHEWMEEAGFTYGKDFGVVIWMHDEWQFECRPEVQDAAARLGCEAIAEAGRFFNIACPHEGEAKIGKNWYETH